MSQDPGQSILNNGFNFTPTIHNAIYPSIEPASYNLSGKSVFVTGASKGLGAATAITFAKAGASFIALGARSDLSRVAESVRKAGKEARGTEPKVLTFKLDVTDRANVERVVEEVRKAFGGTLDMLINNAGYLSAWKTIGDSDPDDWWQDWEVNIKGVYLVTRAFLPLILASTFKTVVNISSVGGHLLIPRGSAYQTTKLAVLRLTEFLVAEHSEQGLLAFSIHPGGVKTDLALGMPSELHGVLVDEPDLCPAFLVWLVGGKDGKDIERREWLNGRYLSVNWDVGELEGRREDIEKHDLLKVRMAVQGLGG